MNSYRKFKQFFWGVGGILYFLAIAACGENGTSKASFSQRSSLQIEVGSFKEITFPTNEQYFRKPFSSRLAKIDGKTYITQLSRNPNRLVISNLNDNKIIYDIAINDIFQENKEYVFDAYVYSLDSIFLHTLSNQFILFDAEENSILNSWTPKLDRPKRTVFSFGWASRMHFYRNRLIVPYYILHHKEELDRIFSENCIMIIELGKKPGQYGKETMAKYPENYQRGAYYGPSGGLISLQPVEDEIWASFAMSHDLFSWNLQTHNANKYQVKKKKYPPLKPFISENGLDSLLTLGSFQEEADSFEIASPRYFDLFYLKRKKLLVRVFGNSLPFRNENGEINKFSSRSWSIVAFDFETRLPLEHFEFEANKYYFNRIMATDSSLIVPLVASSSDTVTVFDEIRFNFVTKN